MSEWENPLSQSSSDQVASRLGPKKFWERVHDGVPCVFVILFVALVVLSVWPPFEGFLARLGNLLIIGGTACIASGVIMPSKMIRHAHVVVQEQNYNPTRYVTRDELVQIIGEVVSDMQGGKRLSTIADELDRRWREDRPYDNLPSTISMKNVAQAFVRSSIRTYVGSVAVIVGTMLLGAEQISRIGS
ncbi:hypothetical protein ACM9XB_06390 [Xanthomonas sacchari]